MASSSTKNRAKRSKSNKETNIEKKQVSKEDVDWLSSLSEPELDFLISLKELVAIRAKNAGHAYIAEKFDLRMLRSIGLVLLEYLKERAQSTSVSLNEAETSALLNSCELLTSKFERTAVSKTCDEEIVKSSFVAPKPKRLWEGLREEELLSCKKQKRSRKAK